MTRRHELDLHREKLHDIRNIMHSMKTLAHMETHKLERTMETVFSLSKTIDDMATDFLAFFSETRPVTDAGLKVVLLVGSGRGFCGDFNGQVVQELQNAFPETGQSAVHLISIGSKLQSVLEEEGLESDFIEGADVSEEVIEVVASLSQVLSGYQETFSLYAIYHDEPDKALTVERLLPPFTSLDSAGKSFGSPPMVNMPPRDFFLELTDFYLNNELHRILNRSLLTENQLRIRHLENATRHLDKKTEALFLKINALRQEEIIEEIEVILLNQADIRPG